VNEKARENEVLLFYTFYFPTSTSFILYRSARLRRIFFLSPSRLDAFFVRPRISLSVSFFRVIALPYDFRSISRVSCLKSRSSWSLRALPVNGRISGVTSGSVKKRRIAGYSLLVRFESAAQSSSHGMVLPIVKPRVLSRLKYRAPTICGYLLISWRIMDIQ